MKNIQEISNEFSVFGLNEAIRINGHCGTKEIISRLYAGRISMLLDSMVAEVNEKKIAGGNYNCGYEGCCNPNPEDQRELEDVEFQSGYNQAILDFIKIIESKK